MMKQCRIEVNVVFLLMSILSIVIMSGCKSISYVDELFLLKTLSEEQLFMSVEVEESDRRFEALLRAVESGDILDYNFPMPSIF